MRIKNSLPTKLKYQAVLVEAAAREAGLVFHDVVFELLDARDVNGIAALGGFPVRYPSWRFGMEYERLEKGHRWGLSRIYELVINSDPTYAYLVRSNSMLEQKLVMAHVYGHADFFRNNVWFSPTDRQMIDRMADHATRVRRLVDRYGQERVERVLDRALSLETLIDPYLPLRELRRGPGGVRGAGRPGGARGHGAPHGNGGNGSSGANGGDPPAGDPPTYDVLGFLCAQAPLEPWEREVLAIVRAEAYYFAPQRLTKIMNEGWASYWHSRLLTGGLLEPAEIVDFADCHSAATVAQPGRLNPYRLGLELFREAERRGQDLFHLRAVHDDATLIDEIADEDFVRAHVLPPPPSGAAGAPGAAGEAPPDWREQKRRLLAELAWGGAPRLQLVAVDGAEHELCLVHRHDGRDLDLAQARAALLEVSALWRGPAQLLTLEDGQGRRLTANDGKVTVLETKEALAACREAA